DVIRDEPDGIHQDVFDARSREFAEVFDDVWSEPRHLRWPAAALVDQVPRGDAGGLGGEPARFTELALVGAVARHRIRGAVRGKNQSRLRTSCTGDLFQCGLEVGDVGLDERRVIVEHPELVELGHAFTYLSGCADDVFTVLTTAGVARETRGDENDRALNAV